MTNKLVVGLDSLQLKLVATSQKPESASCSVEQAAVLPPFVCTVRFVLQLAIRRKKMS